MHANLSKHVNTLMDTYLHKYIYTYILNETVIWLQSTYSPATIVFLSIVRQARSLYIYSLVKALYRLGIRMAIMVFEDNYDHSGNGDKFMKAIIMIMGFE